MDLSTRTDGLVFCTARGTPLLKTNVRRAYKRLLARADLPETIRFHDLRHANATITLGVYAHVVPGQDAEAAQKVQRAIEQAAILG